MGEAIATAISRAGAPVSCRPHGACRIVYRPRPLARRARGIAQAVKGCCVGASRKTPAEMCVGAAWPEGHGGSAAVAVSRVSLSQSKKFELRIEQT